MSNYQILKANLLKNKKKWLVTGAAGFIGSNITEMLLKLDQHVVALDNFSTGKRINLDKIKSNVSNTQWNNFEFVEGDINSFSVCEKVTCGVDAILHQAALGSVPRSIEDPINSNASNVSGFLNLLQAANLNGVKRFVYASSSSVYGDNHNLPKKEDVTGNLLSPYAVTKYANELYAGVFHKCYGMETIGLRYFNVFGKRQDPNGVYAAVMPKWIKQILDNEPLFINGDGETSRDFTYIDNVVQANIIAAMTTNSDAFGTIFNTAAGGRETLNNLHQKIVDQIKGVLPDLVVNDPIYRDFRAGDIRHSNASIDKAKEIIGYEPSHTLEQGLIDSISWYIEDLMIVEKA
jgi:UDP-N-acetylglucosamine 4-epimerase